MKRKAGGVVTTGNLRVEDDSEAGACRKSFVEHLEDLRGVVLWSLAAFAVGTLVALPLAPMILELVKAPLVVAGRDPALFLRTMSVTGGVSIAMSVSFWAGLILSLPVILYQVAWFVFPGLTRIERRTVLRSFGVAAVLFLVGVVACYKFMLAMAVAWLLKVNEWLGVGVDFVLIGDYLGFVMKLLLAFGLAFEFPMVILVLAGLGVLNLSDLREKRRHVVVGVLIVAAILTPTVDPLSQIALSLPLYLMYEACILILWIRARGAQT